MRVLTWNCRRATHRHSLWGYLGELSPDVALLQEVTSLPEHLSATYDIRYVKATRKDGTPQSFGSAVLVRGAILEALPLQSAHDWVNAEVARFAGHLLGYRVRLGQGPSLDVLGVYSPAWPVDRARLAGIDTRPVKLALNAHVWVADLVRSVVQAMAHEAGEPLVVGGDFNLSETFDAWRGGPRGNREYLDRMEALGLTECLRFSRGQLTPTFRNPKGGTVKHQIDHLFVSQALAPYLVACRTGDAERVFGGSLSDHLPVIADFRFSQEKESHDGDSATR